MQSNRYCRGINCELIVNIMKFIAVPNYPTKLKYFYQNDGIYQLKWKLSMYEGKIDDTVTNYTVFWCETDCSITKIGHHNSCPCTVRYLSFLSYLQ